MLSKKPKTTFSDPRRSHEKLLGGRRLGENERVLILIDVLVGYTNLIYQATVKK